MQSTIAALIGRSTDAKTIGAPDRPWLDGAGLASLAASVAATLAAHGIGPGDRVGIVLPNGPEMATAFLTIAAACCAAPLNPAYKADEFDFYLSDLKPAAIVLAEGGAQAASDVAGRLGIPVLRLVTAHGDAAGLFRLEGPAPAGAAKPMRAAGPDDPALVLHTSGTTARPKIVPLTNANVVASAHHIARSLALGPDDVCLNVMPLFHIHGLIAAVSASLAAGAAVCCTPGFNAFKFAELLRQVRPTWYTAVPTMHQAILMRMRGNPDQAGAAKLRFIRSSSASLPPQVMAELEEVFGSPVIEAYGMTEAAHQMAANPLPPRARKPGAVGVAAGPEIAIMDDSNAILPQGAVGEVVIRGPNVTLGYDNNPAANEKAFSDGWFRTGDQGRLDEEGYLFLTGRLKEQINRGGEKISPLEVDVVLLDHPAVAQACTFGIPHAKLGEEVGAVVVLRPETKATESDIREFASARLAAFKVPRKILLMDDIPKGATGKIQRIGLAGETGPDRARNRLMPSICVFGAGAIGGLLAARLEAAGTPVSIVARGAHLAAVQRDGLVLLSGGERIVTRPNAVPHGDAIGPQDYLILTLKAHSVEPALPQLAPLVGPHTTIVTAINGIPWWYGYGLPEPFGGRRVVSVDPTGALAHALPPAQCLGSIVYPAATVPEPGVVDHSYGDRFSLGEPDGTRSPRANALSALMIAAGLKAPVRPRIRDELWVKLWGNMAFNPISALTTATLDVITGDPGSRAVARAMMLEGQAVAEAMGIRFAIDVEKRIEGAAEVGRHKTSMLVDLEMGRPLEIEALLGAVVELADWVNVPAPISHAMLALVRQRAAMRLVG